MTLRVAQVQEVVARYYGLSRAELLGPSHKWRISHPRQAAIALCSEFVPRVTTTILGRLFHRDHTTVIHAIDQVQRREWRSPAIAHDMAALRQCLRRMEPMPAYGSLYAVVAAAEAAVQEAVAA